MINLMVIAAALAQAPTIDRTYEGNWYVSDSTSNNTGEREVYAFQLHLKARDPDYVTLTMRCSNGKPTILIDWQNITFPDQAVITLGPVADPDSEPAEVQYVFEKSEDSIERGMRASSDTSAKIVSAIGQAKYITITAHLSAGSRTVGMDINGTQAAWSRVSRHCPVQILELPPL